MSGALPVIDENRELLWKRVTERWDEPATHGAFLEYCQRTNALSEAAARYRGMAGDRDRGPEARRRLDAVVLLATQAMMVNRTPPRRGTPLWLSVVVGLLCALGVGYTMMRTFGD